MDSKTEKELTQSIFAIQMAVERLHEGLVAILNALKEIASKEKDMLSELKKFNPGS